MAGSAHQLDLWPTSSIDPFSNLLAPANETSTDEKYLRHPFVSYAGWLDPNRGFTPPEAREAVEFHLRGWPYMAASLARHINRFSYIAGAKTQRAAPPLRTQWRQEASRGPRWVVDECEGIWSRQFRPSYREKIDDMAVLGGSVIHVHYVPDVKAGIERPVLSRWPHEAMFFRAASPGWPGGWYAVTNDSGLVRMVPGDGHWIFLAHGERWHESAAILSLGELFVGGKLAERDEAALSAAAGMASPIAELPLGQDMKGEIAQAVLKMVAGLGVARRGAIVPSGTHVNPFEVESDTQFFDRYGTRLLIKCGLAILGKPGSLTPSSTGVYTPIVGWSVDEALTDQDHEATVRGWDTGLVRPFCDINGTDSDCHLVGERYADANAAAKAIAERATLHADTIGAQRQGGLDPSQDDSDKLADKMHTPRVKLGPKAAPAGPTTPPANLAQKEAAAVEAADTKP